MARTLFFRMVPRKFLEITNNKPIFSTIFFYKYFFFNLRFDLFSIIVKKVNHVRNNVACVVVRLVFVFCSALTTGRSNVNLKKSEFYGPLFQTMLFLVTVI